MAIGFGNHFDFRPIVGWELYQVTIDKYHIMFWFENGHALLNIADRFSFKSADGQIDFAYEIYGNRKFLNVDRILRRKVVDAKIISKDQLDLSFDNGDILSVYDNPELRSWWFLGGGQYDPSLRGERWAWEIGDNDVDLLTEVEIQNRLKP